MDIIVTPNSGETGSGEKQDTPGSKQVDRLRAEIDKFQETLKGKYTEEFDALINHVMVGTSEDLEFKNLINLKADVFRGYLLYLRASLEKNKENILMITTADSEADYLMASFAAMSIVASGGNFFLEKLVDGVKVTEEIGFDALEKAIVEHTELKKDYPLVLKLAEDGGPEFSRVASNLLGILKTRNFEAEMSEMDQREAAIRDSMMGLFVSRDWEALRLLPGISDKENHYDNETMFWISADKFLLGMAEGMTAIEAYKEYKGAVGELAVNYLNRYHAAGDQVKDADIEDLTAICNWLVRISQLKAASFDQKFVEEESKSLRDRLFAYIGERIGPAFLQKTTRTIELNEDDSAKLIGVSKEEIWTELNACREIINTGSAMGGVTETFLINNKAIIAKGFGLRRILMGRAIDEIGKIMTEKAGQNISRYGEGQLLLRDFAILNLSMDGIDTPEDLVNLLPILISLRSVKVADKVYEKALAKYWQMPGATRVLLKGLVMAESDFAETIDLGRVVKMLTPAVLKKYPNILRDLTVELLAGDYRTFHNACLLASVLVNSEKGWGEVAKTVAESLFSKREDCLDPDRIMVLRNIMLGLKSAAKAVFFKKGFVENPFFIGVNMEERVKLGRMLDIKVDGPEMTEQLAKLHTGDFGELKIDGKLEERNTKEFADYISGNSSIILSADGKWMTINSGNSPLADNFSEIRFSLNNKEAKKNTRSLACNIALKLKEGGITWYFSIDADNNLLCRIPRAGNLVAISKEQFIAGLPEIVRPNGETNMQVLNEIYYLILKKLEELFVRKAVPPKDTVVTAPTAPIVITAPADDNQESDNTKPDSKPPESGQIMTDGMSKAEVRKENPGVVDLADKFAEAARMAYQNINTGSEGEKDAARQVKMKIGKNRELALQIFGQALANRSEKLSLGQQSDKLELPLEMPEGLANLIVYRADIRDSENYFSEINPLVAYRQLRDGEITSDEIFVRYGSAHSQTLPYLKMEATDDELKLSKGEIDGINVFWAGGDVAELQEGALRSVKEAVMQAKAHDDKMALRMDAFASSRENKNINLKPKEKILYFDVDDSPEQRKIFERMRKTNEWEIRASVSRSMRMDLHEQLLEAKAKLVNPNLTGDETMAGIMAYEALKQKLENACEESIDAEVKKQLEIQSYFTKVTLTAKDGKEFVKLRMPAVFEFNQTFNQGRFQSLSQLFESLDPAAKKKYDEREVA